VEAVLLNPYQYYADVFIDLLYTQHGIRTIALHSDWRTRLIRQPRMPILDSPAVSAHYMVPPQGVAALVPMLRRRHDVVAVLPHDEGAVAPLVTIAQELGLPWGRQPILTTLHSKQAVKRFIATADPGVRLNQVARVSSAGVALEWAHSHEIDRFVLKPDAGSGNRGIGFFDTDGDPATLADYFAQHPGEPLAEEYIGGVEYWVNGQTGPEGDPVVSGLGIYDRRSVNGKENVEVGSRSIASTHPAAAELGEYARRVVTAMGLQRSPFHLEAKVDDRGPCLIEVGARLCGEKVVAMDGWAHGTDLMAAAVDGYADARGGRTTGLDWGRYDSHRFVAVNGSSTHHDVLAEVAGVAEVESMPGFVMWIKKPEVGDTIVPTRDLLANPWSLYLWGPDDPTLDRADEEVRATVALTGLSQTPRGLRARWPVYRERVGRYWRARIRVSQVRSWGKGRRSV